MVLILPDDKPFQMKARRFHVLIIDAGVAHQRIRHGHDLAFIGRIGDDFLITGHGGVENNFPQRFARTRKGKTFKGAAVFQD